MSFIFVLYRAIRASHIFNQLLFSQNWNQQEKRFRSPYAGATFPSPKQITFITITTRINRTNLDIRETRTQKNLHISWK